MDIYHTYSAILMALVLFYSQLKTAYARFPFGVRNIVNEDPEQYESDLKRDMGMMPRTHFVYINGEPEISEQYHQISGELEKAKNDKYDSYSLRDTKPLEHHHNIKNEPEELKRENSSEYNIGRIMPRAYNFKDSEMDNMYHHENYGRKISNDVGNNMQRSYRASTVGRELEDLSNENNDDSYENWHSESEENNYDENSENKGEYMGVRRIVHTKNQQTKTGSNEENSDENDDVDSADWSTPTYDENIQIEGKDKVDMNTQRIHSIMNRKQYESDLNRDMGMMMSPARFGAINQEPERYSLIEGYRVNRGMSGNMNSENDVLDMNMRRNIYTTNRESEYDNNDENSDHEDEDDVDGGTPNYDENSDDEKGTPRLEEPKMVEDTNEDYSSMSGIDVGELSSPRRGGFKTSSECANSGGECKVKCHKNLQYGNRGCGSGQVCCLVAYRVVALY